MAEPERRQRIRRIAAVRRVDGVAIVRVWIEGHDGDPVEYRTLATDDELRSYQYVDEVPVVKEEDCAKAATAVATTAATASVARTSPRRRRALQTRAREMLYRSLVDEPTRDDTRLDAFADLLAYKVVQVRIDDKAMATLNEEWAAFFARNAALVCDVRVLLMLQIPGDRATIFHVDHGSGVAPPAELEPCDKYCTDRARTIGAQFLGASQEAVRAAMLLYQCGLVYFGSDYDGGKTRWELGGAETEELRAGQECGHGKCGRGLYFFLDVEQALSMWGAPAIGRVILTDVVVSKRLPESRGLVLRAPDEEASWNKATLSEQRAHRLGVLRTWADRAEARAAPVAELPAATAPDGAPPALPPTLPPALTLFLDDLTPAPVMAPIWPRFGTVLALPAPASPDPALPASGADPAPATPASPATT